MSHEYWEFFYCSKNDSHSAPYAVYICDNWTTFPGKLLFSLAPHGEVLSSFLGFSFLKRLWQVWVFLVQLNVAALRGICAQEIFKSGKQALNSDLVWCGCELWHDSLREFSLKLSGQNTGQTDRTSSYITLTLILCCEIVTSLHAGKEDHSVLLTYFSIQWKTSTGCFTVINKASGVTCVVVMCFQNASGKEIQSL